MSDVDVSEIVESFENQHSVETTPDDDDTLTAGNCAGTWVTGCL